MTERSEERSVGQTAASLPARATAADPAQPLLTWYDDGTGERIELSGLTLSNWVAKTANLLVDGCGLGPGDTALVALPPHWQTAGVLLGCWSAGLSVSASDGDVAFASAAVDTSAGDRFLLGLAPMGLPMRGAPPPGWLDYIAEVRGHGDRFVPATPARPGDAALGTETHAALVERALARAEHLGIPTGGRVLIDAGAYPDPVDWLLAPLASGASIVLCKDLDSANATRRAEVERAGLSLF
jgi:uncharacterized protein (TIGR03089 family)